MDFKEIVLKLLNVEFITDNSDTVAINANLWNEIYSIMLSLTRLYGANATKETLKELTNKLEGDKNDCEM